MSDVIQLVLNDIIDVVRNMSSKRKRDNSEVKLTIKKPKYEFKDELHLNESFPRFVHEPQSPYIIDYSPPLNSPPLYGLRVFSPLNLPPSLCDFDRKGELCRITHWRDPDINVDPSPLAPDGSIGSIFHAKKMVRNIISYTIVIYV